jgi:lysophospholipase L1-like esterase
MDELERDIRILERRISRLEHQNDLIAFYGSSTVRLWSTFEDDLYPLNALNLGFGGSHFDACIQYFDRVFEHLLPSKVVLYGGDNDLSLGYNAHQINDRFEKLCMMIRSKYEKIPIYGISIKPSPQREDKMDIVKEANQLMAATLDQLGHGAQIDVFHALLGDDQKINWVNYMEDGLHLSLEGYHIWSSEIRKHFFD